MSELQSITNGAMESSVGANTMAAQLHGQDPAARKNRRRTTLKVIAGIAMVAGAASCSTKSTSHKSHSERAGVVSVPATTIHRTPVPGSLSPITEPQCTLTFDTSYAYGYKQVSAHPLTPNPKDPITKATYDIYPQGSDTPREEVNRTVKDYTYPLIYLNQDGDLVRLTIDFQSGAEVSCQDSAP